MRHVNRRSLRLVSMVLCSLCYAGAKAKADPLTTFTLTDLGSGSPSFASAAGGSGIVLAPNGRTAFPFQQAQPTALSVQQLLASHFPLSNAPPPISAPGAYGDPANVYSTLLTPSTNGNGTYVAIDAFGVYGHGGASEAYSVKQNADGTWGPPVVMWSGDVQFQGMPNPGQSSITGINKLNEALGVGSDGSPNGLGLPQTYLYNINTNTLTNLGTLNVLTAGGWNNIKPIAIDAQGRILLQGFEDPATGDRSEHTLLLTPQGVSSPGQELAAPEPGALALGVLILAALAVRRAIPSWMSR